MEAGKAKVKTLADSRSDEGSFPFMVGNFCVSL
jgi:hypothetical protein